MNKRISKRAIDMDTENLGGYAADLIMALRDLDENAKLFIGVPGGDQAQFLREQKEKIKTLYEQLDGYMTAMIEGEMS